MIICFTAIFLVSICLTEHIKFENVKREFILRSHKINARFEIQVKNYGVSPRDTIEIIFKRDLCSKIFKISAGMKQKEFEITERPSEPSSRFCYYKLFLSKKLSQNESVIVYIELIFGGRFQAYPEQVSQHSDQSFIFKDDLYIDSMYDVVSQTTEYFIDKRNVLEIADNPFVETQKDRIRTGPFENVLPFETKSFHVIFKYDQPIFIIDKMTKSYQVSEWGFINVQEDFWVHNDAAALKEGYSRLADHRKNSNAVYQWNMDIPKSAYRIYYRDGLGNISTSSISHMSHDSLTITLVPRFPIFGGWKTYYYVAYIITPLNFLFSSKTNLNHKTFRFQLFGKPMDDFLIHNALIQVLLPEGATHVTVSKVDSNYIKTSHTIRHSYLDFTGRPTIEFEVENGCQEKDLVIEISYNFESYLLFKKPLSLVIVLFITMTSIAFIHSLKIPLFITAESKVAESIEDLVQKIKECSQRIAKNCDTYMLAVCNYKIEKSISALSKLTSKLSEEFDREKNQIEIYFKELSKLDSSYSAKGYRFKVLNEKRLHLLNDYERQSKDLVDGTMSREDYTSKCKPLEAEIQKIHETIYTLVLNEL